MKLGSKKSTKDLGVVRNKKKSATLQARKSRAGWFFVAPFILGFLFVYLPIIIDSIKYSFHEIKIITGGGYDLVWVGLNNYKEALQTSDYIQALSDSITGLIMDIPTILLFSLFIAILLNQKMVGRGAFRAIFFIPVILSTGIIASIDASKIGRKKTILGGIVMLATAFGVAAFMRADSPLWLMNIMFCLAGIAWATINVNSFPSS